MVGPLFCSCCGPAGALGPAGRMAQAPLRQLWDLKLWCHGLLLPKGRPCCVSSSCPSTASGAVALGCFGMMLGHSSGKWDLMVSEAISCQGGSATALKTTALAWFGPGAGDVEGALEGLFPPLW